MAPGACSAAYTLAPDRPALTSIKKTYQLGKLAKLFDEEDASPRTIALLAAVIVLALALVAVWEMALAAKWISGRW